MKDEDLQIQKYKFQTKDNKSIFTPRHPVNAENQGQRDLENSLR